MAECSITFYIVLIMSDVCGVGRGKGERALRAFITGSELYGGEERVSGGRETDASIELSVIPPQTQTETVEDLYNLRATPCTICLHGCSRRH